MLANDLLARPPDERSERERDEHRIIELANPGQEVGHEVEGHDQVGDHEGQHELVGAGHPRIPEQPANQDHAVGE